MSGDRPWMKFYPRDWRGDQALRAVSIAARGLWLECLCIMHEARPYGHLLLNGEAIGDDALARMTGASAEEVRALMAELRKAGVLSVTRGGVVFSRRMIKDDAASKKGEKSVKKRWAQQTENEWKRDAPNRSPNREPITHMPEARIQKEDSSLRSEARASAHPPPPPLPKPDPGRPPRPGTEHPDFTAFWASYPRRSGSNSRKAAFGKFCAAVKAGADPQAIIAGARRYAAWCDATGKSGTEFVRQASTFLNQQDWEGEFIIPQGWQNDRTAGSQPPSSGSERRQPADALQRAMARLLSEGDDGVRRGDGDPGASGPNGGPEIDYLPPDRGTRRGDDPGNQGNRAEGGYGALGGLFGLADVR